MCARAAVVVVLLASCLRVANGQIRDDPDTELRRRVAWDAAHAQAFTDESLAALVAGTLDTDPFVREWSVRGLGRAGVTTRPVLRTLAFALEDEDRMVRRQAALALGRLGPGASSVVPKLAKSLESVGDMPAVVGQALARLGPDGMAALLDLMRSGHAGVAPGFVDVPAAIAEQIAPSLASEKPAVRYAAAAALEAMGPAAVGQAEPLIGALADPVEYVRAGAEGALRALGPGALPALEAALASGEEERRSAQLTRLIAGLRATAHR